MNINTQQVRRFHRTINRLLCSICSLVAGTLLIISAAAQANTPDGQPPSVETFCNMFFTGNAKGLCNAYCEATDCHLGTNEHASPTACANLLDKFRAAGITKVPEGPGGIDYASCQPVAPVPPVASINCVEAVIEDYGSGTAKCTVFLNKPAPAGGESVDISYNPSNGEINEASADFNETAVTSVSFLQGEMMKMFNIPIVNDLVAEQSPELFDVTLTNPMGVSLGTPLSATIAIGDNDCVPPPPRDFKFVFVTSGTYTGNLRGECASLLGLSNCGTTGLDAGNAICRKHASDSSKCLISTNATNFVAWLSDSNTDARDRVNPVPEYRLPDGTTSVSNDGNLLDEVEAALTQTEDGINPTDFFVWTGTFTDGTRSGATCANWSSGVIGAGGLVGFRTSPSEWTDSQLAPRSCNNKFHLYCFEQ